MVPIYYYSTHAQMGKYQHVVIIPLPKTARGNAGLFVVVDRLLPLKMFFLIAS
jgi:hypothetical protein